MIGLLAKLSGHICPHCGKPVSMDAVNRMMGLEDAVPAIVDCAHCGTKLKAKGNGLLNFFKMAVFIVAILLLLSWMWLYLAAIILVVLVLLLRVHIVGIVEAS